MLKDKYHSLKDIVIPDQDVAKILDINPFMDGSDRFDEFINSCSVGYIIGKQRIISDLLHKLKVKGWSNKDIAILCSELTGWDLGKEFKNDNNQ